MAAHQRLDRIRDDILHLGLERNVLELELYGYTLVEDAMPEAFLMSYERRSSRSAKKSGMPAGESRLRDPSARALMQAIPLEAKKGSVAVFNGNLWHSAGARTIPGEWVGMTVYFNRMYVKPQEDLNAVISDAVLARNPPRFAHLIGRDSPYPARDFGFINPRGAKYFSLTADPRG